ncbi:hypothetical protein GQ42DRAFT_68013 [Ramicandelaber brevisporus]|nr:hypothetical protein GQ42DRAFT_68013 [Ramicandelaber brevisporus]
MSTNIKDYLIANLSREVDAQLDVERTRSASLRQALNSSLSTSQQQPVQSCTPLEYSVFVERLLQSTTDPGAVVRDELLPPHGLEGLTTLQSLISSTEQLESGIGRLEEELRQARARLAADQRTLAEVNELGQVLSRRAADAIATAETASQQSEGLPTRSQQELALQRQTADLKAKMARTSQFNVKIMRELMAFLDTHYPPVTITVIPESSANGSNKSKSKRRKSNNSDADDEETELVVSMKDVLEDLMNTRVTRQDDPFVHIPYANHPKFAPQIALLLRAGIAYRHPDHPLKMALTDFRL